MTELRLEEVEGREALTGVPEFDMMDPLGAMVAHKYMNGYISSCSMGHAPLLTSMEAEHIEQGQVYETVLETELLEVSMTNIPGDRDAVILRLSNGASVNELRKINNKHKSESMELTKITALLGLNDNASEKDITEAITTLQLSLKSAQSERVKSLMNLGVTNGHVNDENRSAYERLAHSNYDEVAQLLSAVPEKEDTPPPAAGSVVAAIRALGGEGRKSEVQTLTFDKLSKENPKELQRIQKEDPALYSQLAADYVKGVK